MQTLSQHAPDATRHRAAGVVFVSGTAGARGRHASSPAACAARPSPAEGDLIFTTAATGWGEILTDPSYAGPDRGPHPSDGRQLPDRSGRARVGPGPCPRAGRDPAGDATRRPRPVARGAAGRGRHSGARGHRHPRADARAAPRRRATRGDPPARRADDEQCRRTPRRPRRPSTARPGRRSTTSRRSRPDDAVPARRRSATRAGRSSSTTASSARCCARSPARGLEVTVLPHDAIGGGRGRPCPGPRRPLARPGRSVADDAPDRDRGRPLAAATWPAAHRSSGSASAISCSALAAGAPTRRLAVGHHGGNHAVIETATGRVDIGAHNHEVEVLDAPELAAAGYRVSHRDLNDGTVEGLVHASGRIASVQFHPEGAPGPIDAAAHLRPGADRRRTGPTGRHDRPRDAS